MKDDLTTNIQLESGSPAFAKPVLAAVASTNDDTKHKTFFLFFFKGWKFLKN